MSEPNVDLAVFPPSHPLLAGIEPGIVRGLLADARLLRLRCGEVLFREREPSDAVFLLERGSVRLTTTRSDGQEMALAVLRAPATIGAADCMTGARRSALAEALEPCSLIRITSTALFEATHRSLRLNNNLLRDAVAQMSMSERRQKMMALDPAPDRIARVLMDLIDEFGLPVKDGIQIRVQLNLDDIASYAGATRRSVTRALSPWREQGVLFKRGRYFVIADTAPIAAAAGDERGHLVHGAAVRRPTEPSPKSRRARNPVSRFSGVQMTG